MSRNKREQGFSLLGVIIAIFIFSMGLVGITALANYSLKIANITKMKLIAAGLVQEGMEKARDIRQNNGRWSNWEWYKDPADGGKDVGDSITYQVQYDDESLVELSGSPDYLYFDPVTKLYSYDFGGEETVFTRTVNLEKLSDNEIQVITEVKWTVYNHEYLLTAEDRLWNWR